MAIVNYLGTELDSNVEHELFLEEDFGLDIVVEYTPDSWMYKAGHKVSKFHNCTEFHWRFNEDEDWNLNKSAAFESDIHGTGCTRNIKDIVLVTITKAEKINDDY
jgi:hypothetical protein